MNLIRNVVLICGGLVLCATQAAQALTLTPTSIELITTTDYNKTIDTPEEWFTYLGISPEPVLSYKSAVSGTTGVGSDSGTFSSSYQTIFSNTVTDPSDALIQYAGGTVMGCAACYLLVKDGNNSPAQYLFSLAGWNGTEDIILNGFWPQQGAISNVAIYNAVSTPEPTTLGLMAVGLAIAATRRRWSALKRS